MSQLKLTEQAPEWSGTAVVNGKIKDISLADYKNKYLVLFFYPSDFTSDSEKEITDFNNRVQEFPLLQKIYIKLRDGKKSLSYIGFATEVYPTVLEVKTTKSQGVNEINILRVYSGLDSMNIPLLADRSHKISRDYGVLKEDEGVAFHGLFIIDGKRDLRHIRLNDMHMGQSVDEILNLVEAFQDTQEHIKGGLDMLQQNVYNMYPQMLAMQQMPQQMAAMRLTGAPMGGMAQTAPGVQGWGTQSSAGQIFSNNLFL